MAVVGMGGLFFRAQDPDALNAWYRDNLGVGAGCVADGAGEAEEYSWITKGGPMVFAPFRHDSDYFAADKQFMINLRVTGLDALVARLEDADIAVVRKAEWDDPAVGRFARIHDPEGNAIELWEVQSGAG
jgi:predicted enzyme related to lactoylglutathione lyase